LGFLICLALSRRDGIPPGLALVGSYGGSYGAEGGTTICVGVVVSAFRFTPFFV